MRTALQIQCMECTTSFWIRVFEDILDINDARWLKACSHIKRTEDPNNSTFTIMKKREEDENCIDC